MAIARALASKPRVLLSDEATSALDPDATESILSLLRDLNAKLGLTVVLITHEMAVIKSICRNVAVMEDGRVVEQGDVYNIFAHPVQPITRRFVASANALSRVDKLLETGSGLVQVGENELLVRLIFSKDSVGDSVISRISRDFDVSLNIVLASVEVLEGMSASPAAVSSWSRSTTGSTYSVFCATRRSPRSRPAPLLTSASWTSRQPPAGSGAISPLSGAIRKISPSAGNLPGE